MLTDLKESGAVDNWDYSQLTSAYAWGCLVSHVSPTAARLMMSPTIYAEAEGAYIQRALINAINVQIRLSSWYYNHILMNNSKLVSDEVGVAIGAIKQIALKEIGQEKGP